MAFIKCAQCGQTVLTVASRCPKCLADLKGPGNFGASNELRRCSHCGHGMLARLATCPHCGQRRPSRKVKTLTVAGVLMALMVLFAVLAVLRPSLMQSTETATATPAPQKPASDRAVVPAQIRTIPGPLKVRPVTPAASDSSAVASRPPESMDSTIARARAELSRLSPAVHTAAGTRRTNSTATETRWVSGWANVRGAPNGDSEVVRVLRPGQQVSVVREAGGWWMLVDGGQQVGYVSRSLLAERPDDSVIR